MKDESRGAEADLLPQVGVLIQIVVMWPLLTAKRKGKP